MMIAKHIYKIIFSVTVLLSGLATSTATLANSGRAQDNINFSYIPKRVVVLEFALLDDLLSIGVKPIGIAKNKTTEGSNPRYLLDKTKGIESVGTRQQPELEKIMTLKPDLIIADRMFHGPIMDKLKKITPAVVLNGMLATPSQQMENVRVLGRIFHKQAKAEKVIAKFKAFYSKVQHNSRPHQGTVIFGYALPNGMFRAITANSVTTSILETMGKKNLVTQQSPSQAISMTIENLLAKDPDTLMILLSDTPNGKEVAKKLTENPLWSSLKATRNNRVYYGSRNLWAIDHGVEAMTLMLKEGLDSGFLTAAPARKMMGNPST